MDSLALDVSHLLAGSLVLLSFMMLYQARMLGLIEAERGRGEVALEKTHRCYSR